jgi:AmmeMemoRadiSam system protein A
MISEPDRDELLGIARAAIAQSLARGEAPVPLRTDALMRPAAAFVTLHTHGQLRGCIGHVEADRALGDVVASCAVSAATSDSRFHSITAAELDALEIEISVLSTFEAVHEIDEIQVGRHGLLIESGWRRGLLLPQVAPEWGWDAAQFVAQTCRKAGLPPDAWPSKGAMLFRFEAEVFGEKDRRV